MLSLYFSKKVGGNMPEWSVGDLGIAGLAISAVTYVATKAVEKSKANKNIDPSQAFAELTKAINKLTTFLETEKATQREVNRATEKVLDRVVGLLEELKTRQDAHHDAFAIHANKCELKCHGK